jgi:hypothetical protein
VVGSGGLTAAVDAYGTVVDLRLPGPAGKSLVENSFRRQQAGTVAADTGLGVLAGNGRLRPLREGRGFSQRYLPDSNVLVTAASVGSCRVTLTDAVDPEQDVLARSTRVRPRGACAVDMEEPGDVPLESRPVAAKRIIAAAVRDDRRWLARARPLGGGAPGWAGRAYRRSLLVLRALTYRETGAQVAGARDFWAYVWPRDAANGVRALAAAGYEAEARRVTRFLARLDLSAAARFKGDGSPVDDGRGAPGDSLGWIGAATAVTGVSAPALRNPDREWRDRQDYRETDDERGDYLGNALAGFSRDREIAAAFGSQRGLVRTAHEQRSGLDSAAAWAVEPFQGRRELRPLVRRTLRNLADTAGPFGISPAEDWPDNHPWTAPTAWTAAALARLGERHRADRLLSALHRAMTPAGLLPERVSPTTGLPRSTTPLAWSHAWMILALRARYPEARAEP